MRVQINVLGLFASQESKLGKQFMLWQVSHDSVLYSGPTLNLDGISQPSKGQSVQYPLIESRISMPAVYNLFSLTQGEPNVGIWYLTAQQEQQQQQPSGQPVRLDVDLVEVFCFSFPVNGASLIPPVVDSITSNRRWRSYPVGCWPLPVHRRA